MGLQYCGNMRISFFLTLILSLFSIAVNAQHQKADGSKEEDEKKEGELHHCLFEEKSVMVAIGAPFSLGLETVGINGRAYYNVGEQICFGPEFSFFKKGEEQVYEINAVGHYIFETKWVGIYPLAGVNYTIEQEEGHDAEQEFGVVFGAGIHRNFKNVTVFGEYSHVESELRDDFVTVGLMFSIF